MMQALQEQTDFVTPHSVIDDAPASLADIYQSDINLVCWQRAVSKTWSADIESLLKRPIMSVRQVVDAEISAKALSEIFHLHRDSTLIADIRLQIEMFADLFFLSRLGLRFEKIDKAMCPRFHTDRLVCRLVSTFHGVGTQWLDEDNADRSKLGTGSAGLPDNQSGVYLNEREIHSATAGDVLLLKGHGWPGSPVPGIIHRSPLAEPGSPRLLLTLDFAE